MNLVRLSRVILSILLVLFAMSFISCKSKTSPIVHNEEVGSPTATATATPIPEKRRVKAKALYLTASSAGIRLEHYIELSKKTEVNAYVIDYKDDAGTVYCDSNVELAKELKAVNKLYDGEKVTKQLHDNDIYAIARIVCFKDPLLAKKKPEFAIKNTKGGLYVHNGINWVDAYNKKAWEYNIELAKEAIAKGFDEVQFDYVRFPDGKKSEMVFKETNNKLFYENINEFLAYARQELPNEIISADVFAIICESPADTEQIGQYLEFIGKDVDYLCPMAYPSHYAFGQNINKVKFPKPDLDPYGVVKNTLLKAKDRLSKVEGNKSQVRVYLQDFTATWLGKGNYLNYGTNEVKKQITAVYDAGYEEWILWSPRNTYHEDALEKR